MPRLILLIAIGAVFYVLLKRVASLPPHRRRNEYIKLGLGVMVVVVIGLTLAGKMHWLGAAFTGLLVAARQSLPLLLRVFPLLGGLKSSANAGAQRSTVSTATLSMHLDHESGALSGDVLAGPFKDWRLDDMERAQLQILREYCLSHDEESVQLLDGYLEQRFGDSADPGAEQPQAEAVGPNGMTQKEAREILGIGDTADRDEIIAAHRKLMQKLHPDRGGSDYLAAKINQAKDLLLADEAQ
ncbi:MAG: DnaJ domain-containing protein [Congregibacter sp.]